jgi:hypothetical protein
LSIQFTKYTQAGRLALYPGRSEREALLAAGRRMDAELARLGLTEDELDANILIRAVLGVRVRSLVEAYCERVALFVAQASLPAMPMTGQRWPRRCCWSARSGPRIGTLTVERYLREPRSPPETAPPRPLPGHQPRAV